MNDTEMRTKIEAEIGKTRKIIAEYKEMSQPVAPDDAIGRISRMDAINNKSVTESTLRKAEEKLRALDQVLAKVGTDDFGRCVRCRREIPLGRIMFRPESLFCINCAQ
jgi:DnaK suppressor protein